MVNHPPLLQVPPNQNAQEQDNDGVNTVFISSKFTISIGRVSRGEEQYSVQDLRRALSEDTTLTDLTIAFDTHLPPSRQQVDQGFLSFLLHYIADRNHLRKLCLTDACTPRRLTFHARSDNSSADWGAPSILQQVVGAVVQSGTIHHLNLDVYICPVQALLELCSADSNVKELEIFSTFECYPNNGEDEFDLDGCSTITLDSLSLKFVGFFNFAAAQKFLDFARCMNPRRLIVLTLWGGAESVEIQHEFLFNPLFQR